MDAADIIGKYKLEPHPEGGWYRELYRSRQTVRTDDGRVRCASTAIHFLLQKGEASRWHRVASEELWHFCEGDPLEIHEIRPGLSAWDVRLIGPSAGGWFRVVPPGVWQAARTSGAFTLVSCIVSPGFEFADFRMLADEPSTLGEVLRLFPGAAEFR
jgi:uncharacterized protein